MVPVAQSIQAVILGIVQGLTEFLPISSSAHLLILPWLLGWQPLGLTFDIMVHGGTFLAVALYFRRQWRALIVEFLPGRETDAGTRRLAWALLLGTLPALVAGGLFEPFVEEQLRRPWVTCLTLSGFGLLLWAADRRGGQRRRLENITLRDGAIIGAAQALALAPGVSRAGVTITAALLLGLSRDDSARFSFLLGTPVIALASTARLYELLAQGGMTENLGVSLLVGIMFSFLSGFLCIKYFLRFLQSRTLAPFAVYRLLLAAVIFFLLVV